MIQNHLQSLKPKDPARFSLPRTQASSRSQSRSSASICSSTNISINSAKFSSKSRGSTGSRISRRPSRRGRRLVQNHQEVSATTSALAKFLCTFCADQFPDLYSWKRHEESVHLPRKLWICNGELPGSYSCRSKPEEERTFFRKDNLMQHLRHTHGLSDFTIIVSIENWERTAPPIDYNSPILHCGFCGINLPDWGDRVKHIADHFTSGAKPSEWWLKRADNTRSSKLDLKIGYEAYDKVKEDGDR
jgi:hypothetical protein